MPYQVLISKKMLKVLEKMNEPDYSKVRDAIYDLAEEARPHGYIQLKGRSAFRIKVGNYRIIYEVIDEILTIQIIDLGHRKNIYK
jgi:mRNA interferase RelE/StbE